MKASTRAGSRGAAAIVPILLALIFVAPAAALAADLTSPADPSPSPSPSSDPGPSPSADPGATDGTTPSPSPAPSPDAGITDAAAPSPTPELVSETALVAYYFPQVDPTSGMTLAAVAGVTSTQQWSPWRRTASRSAWVRGLWDELRSGRAIVGRASWYPSTRGWRGVPAVALPGAWFRPRGSKTQRVEVCAGDRCLVVPVVDFCDCRVNSRASRIVDLSRPLVRRLGLKLHKGVYTVSIRLIAGPSPN